MNKTSLIPRVLLLAGAIGLAGLAQADTYDTPQQAGEASTMTHGAPNLVTNNLPDHYVVGGYAIDTRVLGAAPATVTTYGTPTYYTLPGTTTWYVNPPVVLGHPVTEYELSHRSAATFDVPTRAGEASTMTGGAPNLITNNHSSPVVVGTVVPVVPIYTTVQ